MNVGVNLLPGDVSARNAAARQRVWMIAGAFVLLVVLAALYLMEIGQANAARDQLAAEQAQVAALQSEAAELDEFAQLDARATDGDVRVQTALSDQASLAGILQDVALVMPADSQLDSLSVELAEASELTLGATRPSLGSLTATGYTVEDHAPGLERLLIQLDKVASFSNVYFSSSTVDEDLGAVSFSIQTDLGPEVLTARYVDGVPEALR